MSIKMLFYNIKNLSERTLGQNEEKELTPNTNYTEKAICSVPYKRTT